MSKYLHGNSIIERWRQMPLAEQLANIGSEVSRAGVAQGKDVDRFNNAVARGLELFDLTLTDPRWRDKRGELNRACDVFSDAATGGEEYGSTFKDIQKYYDQFAVELNNLKYAGY